MITLNLEKSDFGKNDKWPLLYVFADIYLNIASASRPLNDLEIVEVTQEKYGLTIERRTVRKYRDYLRLHFGLVFATKNKGHYVVNPRTAERRRLKEQQGFLDQFTDYSRKAEEEEALAKKIQTILLAKNTSRCINVDIPHWIHYRRTKDQNGQRLSVANKKMAIAPMEIFCFDREYYLLSYAIEEKMHYLFKINGIGVENRGFLRGNCGPIPDFDLKAHLQKQDYLFTGPVFPSSEPKRSEALAKYCYEQYCLEFERKRGDKCTMPFLLQSLIDLYGEKSIRTKHRVEERIYDEMERDENAPDYWFDVFDDEKLVLEWEGKWRKSLIKSRKEYIEFLEIFFPQDSKTKAILSEIKRVGSPAVSACYLEIFKTSK